MDLAQRIQALGDIVLIISKYLESYKDIIEENDCFNIAGFTAENINTDFGWTFARVPKPDIEKLEQWKNPAQAELLQNQRNKKLDQFRAMRDEKLKLVDVMINEFILNLRQDREHIVEARKGLLDITNPYKKVNGDAKAIIDNLDLNAIEWPEIRE